MARRNRREDVPSTEGFMQLGHGARWEGKLEGTGTVLVHGELKGEIALEGELLVHADGQLRDLRGHATRLRVEGRARGELQLAQAVQVAPAALLEGEIEAPRLDASPGARIEAMLRILPESAAAETGPSRSEG